MTDVFTPDEEAVAAQAAAWRKRLDGEPSEPDPEEGDGLTLLERGRALMHATFPDLDAEIEEDMIEATVQRLRVFEEAKRRVKLRAVGEAAASSSGLHELLAEPDEAEAWRVHDLWPADGRVIIHAQFKAGKSTLFGNLLRSLADGDTFLGHRVSPLAEGETAMLLDFELSRKTLRSWLRSQGIRSTAAIRLETLRGEGRRFAITDDATRARWAAHLRAQNVKVLLLDPLAPILSALGIEESSNTEVGPFLSAVDALAAEAGVQEVIIAHHAGHNGERSRGASRLRDWPDAEWSLVRDEEAALTDAKRYLSAIGRDVSLPESELAYDPVTRRLSLVGGSRTGNSVSRAEEQVLEFLDLNPGAGVREIEAGVRGRKGSASKAIANLRARGLINVEISGSKHCHFKSVPPSPLSPGDMGDVSPRPYRGDTPNPHLNGDAARGTVMWNEAIANAN